MNSRKLIFTFVIALFGAFIGVYTYSKIFTPEPSVITIPENKVETKFASLNDTFQSTGYPDLTLAAEKSINAVVHVTVKSMSTGNYSSSGNPFYDFFFGPRGYDPTPKPQMGFGSGVIISSDGYIITNNHVIDNTVEIEVVLNDRRSFSAKLIGTDPTTDIALLKIDEKNLPFMTYGNSDILKVGEWVIAVGNPFNLTSTVTAGIVSAKSRSINILANPNQTMGIESFIQTDAAVNPGNSGGALVNSKGELVGINTAIASQTGSYSGYSFAVPISIAQKVVADLKEFGVVQRALLGVNIQDINRALAEEKNIDKIEGVFVAKVGENSGAKDAGMEENDIILSVDNELVNSVPELQEKISRHRPGDKVKVLIKRGSKKKLLTVTLRNSDGSTALIKAEDIGMVLGANLKELSADEKRSLQLRNGVKVTSLQPGKLKSSGIREGYIITKANQIAITSVNDFKKVVANEKEVLLLTGIYPNGRVEYYAVNLSNE
ncbi:MAG: Do family serine endopeptidase [Marinilabiliaceae bacterium]|nr:Do family serine endopeptidase [Marinilabiliaceae bacterium]